MSDLEDFELDAARRKPDDDAIEPTPPVEPPRPGPPLPLGLIAVALVMVAAIGAAVFFVFRRPVPRPAVTPPPIAAPSAAASPVEPPISLPALDGSDAIVRELAQGLSSHPQLAAWLASRGLVRTFVVSVLNVAEGRSPAQFVPFLTPKTRFAVVDKAGHPVADPRSFAAYDDFADAVGSLDTAGVARVYRTLRPLLDAAYAELGYPGTDFAQTLERALARLLETPVPEGDVALKKGLAAYAYADPALEGLSLAQKQLLRTGPRNAKLLQAKLRELYRELGFTPHS